MSVESGIAQCWAVEGYTIVAAEVQEGKCYLDLEPHEQHLQCSVCGSRDLVRRGTVQRQLRTLPIGRGPVLLRVPVQRVYCRRCQKLRQVALGFAEPRRSYTRSFERLVLELCEVMCLQDVAEYLQIGWDLVKEIYTRSLEQRRQSLNLRGLQKLAIDELNVGKGRFLSLVLDLESGAVVHVGSGKSGAALAAFFTALKASGAQIQAVAMDMSAAFQAAVREQLPQAVIVFDHFHLVKLFNEKLTDFRRACYREARDLLHKDVLQGTRWLLLKNPQHLDAQKQEPQRLAEALALNQPLATVYYMKEDLRQLWNQKSKADADEFLFNWICRANGSGIAMLQRFTKVLASHRSGILAWYDHRISTGPLEGLNNKIKTLQRQAYGYRDQHFFTLRIYALHEAKYALTG